MEGGKIYAEDANGQEQQVGTYHQNDVDLNPGVADTLHQVGMMSASGVRFGAEMVVGNVVGGVVGAGLGVVAGSAADGTTELGIFGRTEVKINWVHNILDVRPGHLPPTGTKEEVTAAVTNAIQHGMYQVVSKGSFDTLIRGEVYINGQLSGFTGRLVGGVARISTVFQKVP